MRRIGVLAAVSCFVLLSRDEAFGQPQGPAQFEVASVKPAAPLTGRGTPALGPGSSDPERVNYRYVTIKSLLIRAYGMPVNQIVGPPWIEADYFDIEAKVSPGASKEQVNVMLQNLLADRFKLAVHRETREVSIYEMTIAKGGSKLKPYIEDLNPPQPDPTKLVPMDKNGVPILRPGQLMLTTSKEGDRTVTARKQTVGGTPGLVATLSAELGRPVVDKTGLTGDYDYSVTFSPSVRSPQSQSAALPGPGAPTPSSSAAPELVVALEEQLGLKLQAKKGPIEVLVVDGGSRTPTEN